MEKLVYFDCEWILEWVVYVKGVGVKGFFEFENDMGEYIKVDLFNGVGKKIFVILRFL